MSKYGDTSYSRLCSWEHPPKDLIRNCVIYEVPYFGATPVYKNMEDGDAVIKEALDHLYVSWNFSQSTNNKHKSTLHKLPRVKIELSINQIKVVTQGGVLNLDPKRVLFCDTVEVNKEKGNERFLILVLKEHDHNAAYVFFCEPQVAVKIKRTLLQIFDMDVLNCHRIQNSASPSCLMETNGDISRAQVEMLVKEHCRHIRNLFKQLENEQKADCQRLAQRVKKLQDDWETSQMGDRSEIAAEVSNEAQNFLDKSTRRFIEARGTLSNREEQLMNTNIMKQTLNNTLSATYGSVCSTTMHTNTTSNIGNEYSNIPNRDKGTNGLYEEIKPWTGKNSINKDVWSTLGKTLSRTLDQSNKEMLTHNTSKIQSNNVSTLLPPPSKKYDLNETGTSSASKWPVSNADFSPIPSASQNQAQKTDMLQEDDPFASIVDRSLPSVTLKHRHDLPASPTLSTTTHTDPEWPL